MRDVCTARSASSNMHEFAISFAAIYGTADDDCGGEIHLQRMMAFCNTHLLLLPNMIIVLFVCFFVVVDNKLHYKKTLIDNHNDIRIHL